MASLLPTSRFSRVDFPAFGRPISETKPNFMSKNRYHGGHGDERRSRFQKILLPVSSVCGRIGLHAFGGRAFRGSRRPLVRRFWHFVSSDPHLVDPPAL